MDDDGSGGTGRRPDDQRRADDSDQAYDWGGKPGEDFGPIAPPDAGRVPGDGPPLPRVPQAPFEPTERIEARPAARTARFEGSPLRPAGSFTDPPRRRSWGAIVAFVGALMLLGALAGGILFAIVNPDTLSLGQEPATSAPVPAPSPSSVPVAPPVASPVPVIVASPAPVASPTPLALGSPSPPLAPTRTPVPSPTVRAAPAILPGPALFVTPPGLRFPTSTPIRLGTPQAGRTPPPIPSPRLPTVSTRVWSDQVLHHVGDDASICGQTSAGASAELSVIAPDRASRTLGQFATPTERVCYTLKVDQPELWVLTLIVKDAAGVEIERQSAALWVSR